MAAPFPAVRRDSEGAHSEPYAHGPQVSSDPMKTEGWNIYDEKKAAYVDAWMHYYDSKATVNETRWAQYEKNKDQAQRRWRSATESRPSVMMKGSKSTPTVTKLAFNLSLDTSLAGNTRQWADSQRNAPRPDGTPVKPPPNLSNPYPRVPTPGGRPMLSRAKSMDTPTTPSSHSFPSPAAFTPNTSSPSDGRSAARPIPKRKSSVSSTPEGGNPYLSRSAPAAHSPPRTFFAAVPEDLERKAREHSLLQRQAELERQHHERQRLERAQLFAEQLRAEEERERKRALDAELAAARRADEERQRRRTAAKLAAEHAAEEQRRFAAQREAERKREADRRRRAASDPQQRQNPNASVREAWERYEERWRNTASSGSSDGVCSFTSVPWPMASQPRSSEDITYEGIKSFILSPLHSSTKLPKQRVREQLLRFHPDRFEGRWLSRMRDSEKDEVRTAMNSVVRHLNDMLAQCNSARL